MTIRTTGTRYPEAYDDFNPDKRFVLTFNLRFDRMGTNGQIALLSRVWDAPVLPQPDDILHIGAGSFDLVITIDKRRKQGMVWDDMNVTIEATLLHINSPREFLDRVANLLEMYPQYRSQLHASLHIHPAAAMLDAEAARSPRCNPASPPPSYNPKFLLLLITHFC